MLYPLYNSELWTKPLKNDSMKHGLNCFFSNNVILRVRVYMGESFCKISSQLKEKLIRFLKENRKKHARYGNNMYLLTQTHLFLTSFTLLQIL